jgi:hemolysin activation/secretion protein
MHSACRDSGRSPTLARLLAALSLAVLAWAAGPATALEDAGEAGIPSFAELESSGAVIGEIRVDNQNIFDVDDRRENNWLFRFANWLHVRTRPEIIRAQLLFASGEPLSVQRIEETERLLRANVYLYEVHIRPVAWHDGRVDIEVKTRDTWSLAPTAGLSRAGGTNSGGLGLRDYNVLGSGMRISLASKATVGNSGGVSHTGTDFQQSYPNAFGDRVAVGYTRSTFDGGNNQGFTVSRPFYALDARWAAGLSASRDNRLFSTSSPDGVTGQYRRRQDKAEAFGGRSKGLIDGWVHRYSAGLSYEKDVYSVDDGAAPPAQLPLDRKLVAPFLRYEVIQDDFAKLTNVDQIGRPEYFSLGFFSSLQVGRALPALGSTQYASLYSGTFGKGVRWPSDGILLGSASFSGEYADGHADRQLLGGAARYYLRQSSGSVFFSALTADHARFTDGSLPLTLGGDTGLRGYPGSYQSGTQRVLFTAEERFYTDWYPFRLFRFGAAVFYDHGRAWSEPAAAGSRWLSDIGFGLRIQSARAATGTTLHVDFAFPVHRDPGIKSYQFSFMSKTGF